MATTYNCTPSDRVMNLLLLTLAVIVIYMNASLSGAQVFDDVTLINTVMSSNSPLSLLDVKDNPLYFRPLGYMSFYLDLKLLGGDLAITHIISILIHLFNSFLIYMLGLRIASQTKFSERVAMIAAMLFALHPVNAETVIWLSARFDLLCCTFLLISMLLILEFMQSFKFISQTAIFLMFLCSLLTKESAIFFPAVILIYFILIRKKIHLRVSLITLSMLFMAVFVYLQMRGGLTIAKNGWASPTEIIAGLGFYIGKMFYPFPLNFAITSIHIPLHIFLLLCIYIPVGYYLLRNKQELLLPALLMSLALAPPLYAMAKGMPWTPYAERYLYIPMAGFAIIAGFIAAESTRKIRFFPVLCILLVLGLPTLFRVNTWLDHIAFWKDTINKSPGFATPHLILASEYLNDGKFADSRQHLEIARRKGIVRQNAKLFADNIETELNKAELRP